MRDLAAIQRRFYELVTAGEGTIDPGLLGGSRRLVVYAGMYVARLRDVLAEDYPKLRAALGEDAFGALAAAYVRARPPTSFTVRDAGAALPAYLTTREDLPAWSAELARLERARVEVFDGPDAAALDREAIARVGLERFPEVALAFVPSSAVVTLGWTADELWSAIEEDAPREPVSECARTVLVWRRDLQVIHRTLDPDEAELAALIASGATIATVSGRLAELGASEPAQRVVELLARWLDGGVLAATS